MIDTPLSPDKPKPAACPARSARPPQLPALMSIRDAAYQTGRSIRSFRKLIAAGTVRAVVVGRRTLVRGEDVSEVVRKSEPYKPRTIPGLRGHGARQ
jgi:excisionase family DNA binding protein